MACGMARAADWRSSGLPGFCRAGPFDESFLLKGAADEGVLAMKVIIENGELEKLVNFVHKLIEFVNSLFSKDQM